MENKIPNKVVMFIKINGYDKARFLTDWNEYKVYVPLYDSKEPTFTGMPQLVLYQNGKTRFASFEEYGEIIKITD